MVWSASQCLQGACRDITFSVSHRTHEDSVLVKNKFSYLEQMTHFTVGVMGRISFLFVGGGGVFFFFFFHVRSLEIANAGVDLAF